MKYFPFNREFALQMPEFLPRRLMWCLIFGCTAAACGTANRTDPSMNTNADARYQVQGLERPGLKLAIKEAITRVPRHRFVSEELSDIAYSDRALPIAHEQTISQPYVVALMTQAANVVDGSKVLEIGTGSGYQAAVLSELGAKVFTIEIIPELAADAKKRLQTLGYQDINVRSGDGWQGWAEEGPYDAIIVTAAAPSFPPALLEQLAERGKLVMPLEGDEVGLETLVSVQRVGENFVTSSLGSVRFVPLKGEARSGAVGLGKEDLKQPSALESFMDEQSEQSRFETKTTDGNSQQTVKKKVQ